ncbi:hypothetical protein EON65_11160 [archaeon]|nr:MAG: hypothetical protein EON65_11160 [archaeon]
MDKKTSLMDYVVKTLYDKNEESLLLVIDDLSLLGDNTSPLNSLEVLHDLKQIDKQMEVLNQELLRARSLSSVQEIFSSPTAKAISDKYTVQLQIYIAGFEEQIGMLHKRKVLFLRKIQALMEYFGEDVKQTDSSRIFNALKEFRRTLAFSKESVEWKLYRSQQS